MLTNEFVSKRTSNDEEYLTTKSCKLAYCSKQNTVYLPQNPVYLLPVLKWILTGSMDTYDSLENHVTKRIDRVHQSLIQNDGNHTLLEYLNGCMALFVMRCVKKYRKQVNILELLYHCVYSIRTKKDDHAIIVKKKNKGKKEQSDEPDLLSNIPSYENDYYNGRVHYYSLLLPTKLKTIENCESLLELPSYLMSHFTNESELKEINSMNAKTQWEHVSLIFGYILSSFIFSLHHKVTNPKKMDWKDAWTFMEELLQFTNLCVCSSYICQYDYLHKTSLVAGMITFVLDEIHEHNPWILDIYKFTTLIVKTKPVLHLLQTHLKTINYRREVVALVSKSLLHYVYEHESTCIALSCESIVMFIKHGNPGESADEYMKKYEKCVENRKKSHCQESKSVSEQGDILDQYESFQQKVTRQQFVSPPQSVTSAQSNYSSSLTSSSSQNSNTVHPPTLHPIVVEIEALLAVPHYRAAKLLCQRLDFNITIPSFAKRNAYQLLLQYYHRNDALLYPHSVSKTRFSSNTLYLHKQFMDLTVGNTGLCTIFTFLHFLMLEQIQLMEKFTTKRVVLTTSELEWIKYHQQVVRQATLCICLHRQFSFLDSYSIACKVSVMRNDLMESEKEVSILKEKIRDIFRQDMKRPKPPKGFKQVLTDSLKTMNDYVRIDKKSISDSMELKDDEPQNMSAVDATENLVELKPEENAKTALDSDIIVVSCDTNKDFMLEDYSNDSKKKEVNVHWVKDASSHSDCEEIHTDDGYVASYDAEENQKKSSENDIESMSVDSVQKSSYSTGDYSMDQKLSASAQSESDSVLFPEKYDSNIKIEFYTEEKHVSGSDVITRSSQDDDSDSAEFNGSEKEKCDYKEDEKSSGSPQSDSDSLPHVENDDSNLENKIDTEHIDFVHNEPESLRTKSSVAHTVTQSPQDDVPSWRELKDKSNDFGMQEVNNNFSVKMEIETKDGDVVNNELESLSKSSIGNRVIQFSQNVGVILAGVEEKSNDSEKESNNYGEEKISAPTYSDYKSILLVENDDSNNVIKDIDPEDESFVRKDIDSIRRDSSVASLVTELSEIDEFSMSVESVQKLESIKEEIVVSKSTLNMDKNKTPITTNDSSIIRQETENDKNDVLLNMVWQQKSSYNNVKEKSMNLKEEKPTLILPESDESGDSDFKERRTPPLRQSSRIKRLSSAFILDVKEVKKAKNLNVPDSDKGDDNADWKRKTQNIRHSTLIKQLLTPSKINIKEKFIDKKEMKGKQKLNLPDVDQNDESERKKPILRQNTRIKRLSTAVVRKSRGRRSARKNADPHKRVTRSTKRKC